MSSVLPLKDNRRALFAALLYSVSSTLLNLANKVVFSKASFNFPWGTIAIQNIVSLLALASYLIIAPQATFRLDFDLLRRLVFPMWCFCLFLYSNANALRFVSLPVLTVLKSFAPLGVSIMEVLFFKDILTKDAVFCMIMVVASNYVTAYNDVEFSPEGYAWAGINVASNIAYLLTLRRCLSENYDSVQLALHSTLVSSMLIVPISVVHGDFPSLVYSLLETSQKYDVQRRREGTMPLRDLCSLALTLHCHRFRIFFFGSGLLAAGISISTFWCLAETNGSTLSFLGAMNKVSLRLASESKVASGREPGERLEAGQWSIGLLRLRFTKLIVCGTPS
uniref:Sugar phosphate transporter domain-containing protein n=2 Tax=Rhodosorus marinus TaxID=101924 RepID=A0A7S3A9N7_9RHOD|mmetsp:Transcript_8285/g.37003  ORF Transcript_8285/g.37003 Transcript_8285/m.37003 type:complete len:336 (+) Transcript_8285:419-1426(+)